MTPVPNTQAETRSLSNLTLRAITGFAVMPVAIVGALSGGVLWTLLMIPLAAVGTLELISMARQGQGGLTGMVASAAIVVGFHFGAPLLWLGVPLLCLVAVLGAAMLRGGIMAAIRATLQEVAGVLYVGVPVALLVPLRASEDGLTVLLMIFAATWATDTGAYFTGKFFGRRPFFPQISPKKTREGAIGGLLFGGFWVLLIWVIVEGPIMPVALLLALLAPAAAVAGDLVESVLKRSFGAKDSHPPGFNLFPGHGGVLDRIDSLIAVSVMFTLLLFWSGGIG